MGRKILAHSLLPEPLPGVATPADAGNPAPAPGANVPPFTTAGRLLPARCPPAPRLACLRPGPYDGPAWRAAPPEPADAAPTQTRSLKGENPWHEHRKPKPAAEASGSAGRGATSPSTTGRTWSAWRSTGAAPARWPAGSARARRARIGWSGIGHLCVMTEEHRLKPGDPLWL